MENNWLRKHERLHLSLRCIIWWNKLILRPREFHVAEATITYRDFENFVRISLLRNVAFQLERTRGAETFVSRVSRNVVYERECFARERRTRERERYARGWIQVPVGVNRSNSKEGRRASGWLAVTVKDFVTSAVVARSLKYLGQKVTVVHSTVERRRYTTDTPVADFRAARGHTPLRASHRHRKLSARRGRALVSSRSLFAPSSLIYLTCKFRGTSRTKYRTVTGALGSGAPLAKIIYAKWTEYIHRVASSRSKKY